MIIIVVCESYLFMFLGNIIKKTNNKNIYFYMIASNNKLKSIF